MTNTDGIITESVKDSIAPGLTVYDLEGKKVGSVDSVERETGWFTVSTSDFSSNVLYLPFSLVTNIDLRELFLSQSKQDLQTTYSTPPARSSVIEKAEGKTTAITREPSGYDGTPIVVERARIDQLKQQITVGSHVSTSDLKDMGTIKSYDAVTGMMTVEKGVLSKHDLLVPVTVVDYVDDASHDVYLAVSQADLQRMQHPETVNVVLVDAQVTESK